VATSQTRCRAVLQVPTLAASCFLDRCDRDGVTAYTETQKEEHVSWYGRARFRVVHVIELPDTLTVWCLRREPKP